MRDSSGYKRVLSIIKLQVWEYFHHFQLWLKVLCETWGRLEETMPLVPIFTTNHNSANTLKYQLKKAAMYKIVACLVPVFQGNVEQKLIWFLQSVCMILAWVNWIFLCREWICREKNVFFKSRRVWSLKFYISVHLFLRKWIYQQLYELFLRVSSCTWAENVRDLNIYLIIIYLKYVFKNYN